MEMEEEAKDEGSFEPTIIRTETGDANHKTMEPVTEQFITKSSHIVRSHTSM